VNSLPKTVTRQHRGCDLNPVPSAPESCSTLTTGLPMIIMINYIKQRVVMPQVKCILCVVCVARRNWANYTQLSHFYCSSDSDASPATDSPPAEQQFTSTKCTDKIDDSKRRRASIFNPTKFYDKKEHGQKSPACKLVCCIRCS